jgi:hypothetical protein
MQDFASAHLLARCHGFSVEAPCGRIGALEDVLYRTSLTRPDELLVRRGRLRRRFVRLPAGRVVEIRIDERRVLLRR